MKEGCLLCRNAAPPWKQSQSSSLKECPSVEIKRLIRKFELLARICLGGYWVLGRLCLTVFVAASATIFSLSVRWVFVKVVKLKCKRVEITAIAVEWERSHFKMVDLKKSCYKSLQCILCICLNMFFLSTLFHRSQKGDY